MPPSTTAGRPAIGCPVTDDLPGARQEGVCWQDLAIDRGMPNVPLNATVLAVAEKAAALITKETSRWQ